MADEARSDTSVRRTPAQWRTAILGTVASLVRWAGLIVVIVLVARVLLTVGGANPNNGVTSVITRWSDPLAWVFKDLFTPNDAKLRILVNYGIAALFWLIVSAVVARMIRRLG